MKKLTGFSLFCMMLCARIFVTMTFFPVHMQSGLAYSIGAAISTALQGLLMIPAVRLAHICPEGPCAAAMKKSRAIGVGITLCFLCYFIYEIFVDAGSIAYFTDYFFSVNMPRAVTALCCTLSAVYIARLDIAVIGRTAQLAFFGMLGLIMMMAVCSASDMSLMRLDMAVEHPLETVGKAVISETQRCECLVIFTFLAARADGSQKKLVRCFLIAKGILVSGLFLLVTLALGTFTLRSKLPVFALATFSKNLITERSDAVFLLVWMFMGIVKLGLLIHCAARCMRLLFPKMTMMSSSFICGVSPCLAALPLLFSYRWERVVYSQRGMIGVVGLAFVLPILLLRIFKADRDMRSISVGSGVRGSQIS